MITPIIIEKIPMICGIVIISLRKNIDKSVTQTIFNEIIAYNMLSWPKLKLYVNKKTANK